MLKRWHHDGWAGSMIIVVQRRAKSWWASPIASSEAVDHLSFPSFCMTGVETFGECFHSWECLECVMYEPLQAHDQESAY
jgi:hypothetical protein